MEEKQDVIEKEAHQIRLVALLGVIIFFSVLNGTMFNVAVPDIAQQFHLLPSEVSWVIVGYILVFALGSVTYGKLADIYPIKTLISVGLVLFNAGSLLGFFAWNYPVLVGARIFQSAGAAAIPALAMLVATRYFPPGIKGRVFGVISSSVALGTGMGPILGGYITHTFHWRHLFLVTLVTLLTIPFFRRLLPDEPKRQDRFDMAGLILMGLSISLFLIFLTKTIWWTLPAGIVLLMLFIRHIQRTEVPFVNPALFINRPYTHTLLTAFLAMGTVFGMFFMTPIMLKEILHFNASQIGLVLFPGAITGALLGTYGGRLADRKGSVPVVYGGLGLLLAGYLGLSTLAGSGAPVIALILILCYIGFTFTQSSLTHTISETLSREEMGIGMGIYNLFFFMAGAFNTLLIGKLLDLSESALVLNPLLAESSAGLYSNLYLLLAAFILCAAALFCLSFGQRK